ncbi:MAG: Fe-S cluster assembly protein SufD [Gammaproteobacteria bacterium]|nr:Fe-S cluster assembly protein SufD [Gammaproteobacteria bacterium]
MSHEAVQAYVQEFERVTAANAPTWLAERRRTGMDSVRATGFPTARLEDWKYTDVRPITSRSFRAADASLDGVDRAVVDPLRFGELERHELVFVHGHHAAELCRPGHLPTGINLGSLRDAVARGHPVPERHLARSEAAGSNPFVALNTALMRDGAFVSLADGAMLETPIHLLFLSGHCDDPVASFPRNLIVLGRNARATVIEHYWGRDDTRYFSDAVTEVVLGPGATLEHYKLQQEGKQGFHVGTLSVRQERDSRLESHSISLGGALVRSEIHTRLAAEGAAAELNGLYLAGGRQHVDNHTRIDHEQPRTRSSENYRGVLDGWARAVFNGKVIVHKDAQKADAHQSNANLLLSGHAEVDTKPELEIYADDVKCSHGATVGQLDQNMLFYLRTRAIPADAARSLLTFAFADDVIRRIRLAPIRSRLERSVAGRLPDAELIREFMQ